MTEVNLYSKRGWVRDDTQDACFELLCFMCILLSFCASRAFCCQPNAESQSCLLNGQNWPTHIAKYAAFNTCKVTVARVSLFEFYSCQVHACASDVTMQDDERDNWA